ncbi:MAG: riboflavin synthase [Patescibacteria group bacterium]|jgi:riboflavin synthase
MFTGIVKELLSIKSIQHGDVLTVTLTKPNWGEVTVGESILLNGICSTITLITDSSFTVEYMAETMKLTTVSSWRVGDKINAEPALTLTTPLSGNLVYGHIDGVGNVLANNANLTLQLPKEFMEYIILKGSLTIDGVNLTISSINDDRVSVSLIPHTKKTTTLSRRLVEELCNIELDYITKVIVSQVNRRKT